MKCVTAFALLIALASPATGDDAKTVPPAKPHEPYKHWADGRCPFPKTMLESAGFDILAFDRDDSEAVRKMAHALGWDRGERPMDLENDLFAHYTLLKKPKQ